MFKTQEIKAPAEKTDNAFALKEFDKSLLVATYFGFTPIRTPSITKEDTLKQKIVRDPLIEIHEHKISSIHECDPIEKTAILRTFLDWKLDTLPSPVMIAYKKPLQGAHHKKNNETSVGLEIIGLSGSPAEAILIRTAISMLEEDGWKDLSLTINSLGDKDSINDFERMITNYVKKNLNLIPADIRNVLKKDIFEIIRTEDPRCEKVRTDAPKSISFLQETARNHLKEVLEYTESFNIPYSINPSLIGSPAYCSHTLFEIRAGENREILLASGYRYGRLTKKLGFKKELPAVGATVSIKKKEKNTPVKIRPKFKFYLIQLGFGAKMKALKAVEVLRKAKTFVAHSLAKDKLQSQLTSAENMKVPYVLIIGQKEALEETVVVRDTNTRFQESVPINELAEYLKKLQK